jgi:hypothetical protein
VVVDVEVLEDVDDEVVVEVLDVVLLVVGEALIREYVWLTFEYFSCIQIINIIDSGISVEYITCACVNLA